MPLVRSWSRVRKKMLSEDGSEKKTMAQMMSKYLENTAAHGLPNIWRSKNVFRRVWWLVFSIGAISMLGYQIHGLISKYYSYPVNVNVKVNYDTKASFPAVTVCNMNPVKLSKLREIDPDLENAFERNETAERLNMLTALNLTTVNITDLEEFWEELEDSDYFETEDGSTEARETLVKLLDNLNVTTLKAIGHSITDMLLSCTWQGVFCGRRNFTTTFSKTYGTCLTFNAALQGEDDRRSSGTKKPEPLYSYRAGSYFGLQLELFIEDYEYIPELAAASGVRIVIHDRSIMPFPETHGISVSPGTAAEIAIRRREIRRKPLPYEGTDCIETGQVQSKHMNKINLYSELYDVDYSVEACYRTCYQFHMIKTCGCADPYVPYKNREDGLLEALDERRRIKGSKTNISICNSSNPIDAQCVHRNYDNRYTGRLHCNCRERCHDTIYSKTVTTARWPTEASEKLLMRQLSGWGAATMKLTTQVDDGDIDLDENVLRVNIFYEDLTYESIIEEPSYGNVEILSDLGGQLGLWMGLSIVALAEVFEFLADMVYHCIRRRKNAAQVKDLADISAGGVKPG